MCTKSPTGITNLNAQPSNTEASSGTATIHRQKLISEFDSYFVVDVREPAEHTEGHIEGTKINMGLGPLLHSASRGTLDDIKSEKIVVYCNIGYRSGIAQRELAKLGFNCLSLEGGIAAWHDPAASSYEFFVLISSDEAENVTLGLSVALASQKNGVQTAVALMGPSVVLATTAEQEKEADKCIGAPFQPVFALWNDFVKSGGLIFACRSCLKLRNVALEDCADVYPCSAPDVVRWLNTSGGSVKF